MAKVKGIDLPPPSLMRRGMAPPQGGRFGGSPVKSRQDEVSAIADALMTDRSAIEPVESPTAETEGKPERAPSPAQSGSSPTALEGRPTEAANRIEPLESRSGDSAAIDHFQEVVTKIAADPVLQAVSKPNETNRGMFLRLPWSMWEKLDTLRFKEDDKPNRQEMIRRLIDRKEV